MYELKRSVKHIFILFIFPTVPQAQAPVVEQFVKKTMFKMIFPFEARNPDELNLAEGDLVQVY